ncbi:MAG: TetR/AcrR family transcriptional regulator [Actinomycetota bacterium]|nr:TetR/AcrR family transcriptional regulator [Actinomycetota bacterium]
MSRRLTPRGIDRRQQLIDYARRRFAEGGYHPTSVAEIVGGLGVGKGVFYWYFDSKEELFEEILRDAHRELRRRQRAAIGDETDPLRRIEAGIRASVAWSAEHSDLVGLIRFAATEERFSRAVRRGNEVAVGDLVGHLRDGIEQGTIRSADPTVLAQAVIGAIDQLTTMHLRAEQAADPDEIAELAVAFCLGGLAPAAPADT